MLNYREIRSRLRHGDIKRIADSLDIEQRVVSEVLNRGWHPRVRNSVYNEALKLLEDEFHGESELIERAEEINLGGIDYSVPENYKRKSRRKNNPSFGFMQLVILVGLIGAVAWFISPKFKEFIQQNILAKLPGKE